MNIILTSFLHHTQTHYAHRALNLKLKLWVSCVSVVCTQLTVNVILRGINYVEIVMVYAMIALAIVLRQAILQAGCVVNDMSITLAT